MFRKMFAPQAVVFCTLFALSSLSFLNCIEDWSFPSGFKFGAATSAYQVEGAWNISGKGESIWDRFTHATPDAISNSSNGDVAGDSYHLWGRDIEMMEELGLHFYRFSISWPRILPTGFANNVSSAGAKHYSDLIDGLLEKGIEPLVTLYHWDLPQTLQNLGGWTNPLVATWFRDYARVVFTLFGDRVKYWITINEAIMACDYTYNTGTMAPGFTDPEISSYLCNKHILMAHAHAWRLYDEEFRSKYHGEVSLSNHLVWFDPLTEEDEELAELARENCAGRYSHPIYSKEGGWPPAIEKIMAENSLKKGYPASTFPSFTQEEKEFVRGTYDFYAVNHYTSRMVRKAKPGETMTPWPMGDAPDLNAIMERNPDWELATSSWFYINPEGFRRLLVWLKKHYGDMRFIITENGLSTESGLDDQNRVKYYRDYLKQLLLAIKEDQVNITHYTAWTLMDNFEWSDGYNVKFGLYEVDFSDPMRKRTPRASARFYSNLIKSHSLDCEADIDEI